MTKELIAYIELLKHGSFEGWHNEAQKGYLTACISIEEKIKDLYNLDEPKQDYSIFPDE